MFSKNKGGPDFSGRWSSKDQRVFACHERLAIVKPESGEQPLYNQSNTMVLIVNGEIYNYKGHHLTIYACSLAISFLKLNITFFLLSDSI